MAEGNGKFLLLAGLGLLAFIIIRETRGKPVARQTTGLQTMPSVVQSVIQTVSPDGRALSEYLNAEVWSIKRDKEGLVTDIIVHRDAKVLS